MVLLSQNSLSLSNYISIPFKRNYVELTKCINLSEFLSLYIDNPIPIYSEISIGTPKQKIKIFYETDFTSILFWNQIEGKETFPQTTNTYYNYNTSQTFYNYSIPSKLFRDKFFFQEKDAENNNNEKSLEELFNFTMYTVREKDNYKVNKYNLFNFKENENFYCTLGLGLPGSYNVQNIMHILYQLKRKNITKTFYSFSFDFKNNNILLGDLPQLVLKNKYKESDFTSAYFSIQVGLFLYKLIFKTISIRRQSTNEKLDIMSDNADLSFEQFYFTGTTEYKNIIINEFFNLYKDECYENEVEVSDENDFIYGKKKVDAFVCKIDPKNNILKNFPDLIFYNTELNTDFNFTYEDLFIKISDKNEYLFNVIFDPSYGHWIIGLPFFKKYQMFFDVESRKISYYKGDFSETNNDEDKDKTSGDKMKLWIYLGIIFVLAVVFIVIGYFIGKLVNKQRKKKANELSDEDYDYEQEKDVLN